MDLAVEKYIRGDIWSAKFFETEKAKIFNSNYELIPVLILGIAKGRATVMCFENTESDSITDTISVTYRRYVPDMTNVITIPLDRLHSRRGTLDTANYITILRNIITYISGTNIEFITEETRNKLETIRS